MTTMEVVLTAAAIIAALVVLVKIWIHIIIPTWDALVDLWDKTVGVYEAIADFVKDYIIYPIKWVNKKVRRFFMTPLERAKAERNDLAESVEGLQMAVAMGMADQSMVDMLEEAVEAYDEAIADKEARMAAEESKA